jgi:hypothetical protein
MRLSRFAADLVASSTLHNGLIIGNLVVGCVGVFSVLTGFVLGSLGNLTAYQNQSWRTCKTSGFTAFQNCYVEVEALFLAWFSLCIIHSAYLLGSISRRTKRLKRLEQDPNLIEFGFIPSVRRDNMQPANASERISVWSVSEDGEAAGDKSLQKAGKPHRKRSDKPKAAPKQAESSRDGKGEKRSTKVKDLGADDTEPSKRTDRPAHKSRRPRAGDESARSKPAKEPRRAPKKERAAKTAAKSSIKKAPLNKESKKRDPIDEPAADPEQVSEKSAKAQHQADSGADRSGSRKPKPQRPVEESDSSDEAEEEPSKKAQKSGKIRKSKPQDKELPPKSAPPSKAGDGSTAKKSKRVSKKSSANAAESSSASNRKREQDDDRSDDSDSASRSNSGERRRGKKSKQISKKSSANDRKREQDDDRSDDWDSASRSKLGERRRGKKSKQISKKSSANERESASISDRIGEHDDRYDSDNSSDEEFIPENISQCCKASVPTPDDLRKPGLTLFTRFLLNMGIYVSSFALVTITVGKHPPP